MAVTDDFLAAARRCYADGELLFREQRFANASHLFRLGAECALKTLLSRHPGLDAVPAVHLPALQTQALRMLRGNRDRRLQQLFSRPDYMRGWQIDNRYWPDATFSAECCRQYREDCRQTLIAANLGL